MAGQNKNNDVDKKSTKKKDEEDYPMTAGQQFVKAIGPFGCILFLSLFVLFMVYCFTGGFGQ